MNDICGFYDKLYTDKVDEFQGKFFDIYEMRNLEELQWFLGIYIT